MFTIHRHNISACSLTRRAIMRGVLSFGWVLAMMGMVLGAHAAPPIKPKTNANEVEASLVRVFETLKHGHMKAALTEIDEVIARNPNFQLAHLIKGDILMAKAGAPSALSPKNADPEQLANLRLEAQARLKRHFDGPPKGHLPTALLRLAPNHDHALILDSDKSRLYVFRNVGGKPEYVADYYVTVGKMGTYKEREGDQRTPVGVYHVTSTVTKDKLPDFYGPGAFPINFPNEMDRRAGRTGSGIWIHGTPSNTYSRPPRASDGCIVLTNDDFASIKRYVNPGTTPIVIAQTLTWKAPDDWRKTSTDFLAAVESWRHDWEKRDAEAFLSHYSDKFEARGRSLAEWMAQRPRSVSSAPRAKMILSNLSVFAYPNTASNPPMMMVTFDQAGNKSSKQRKSQYWQLERGIWQIIHEAYIT